MFSDTALILAAGGVLPLMLAIAVLDLRDLRIPNWTILATFGVFLLAALPVLPWGLGWEVFLWRIGYGALAFFLGFALYSVVGGKIGAGDLKLLAAIAPFLSAANLTGFVILYVVLSVVGLMLYLGARMIANGRKTGLKGLDTRGYYPAGVLLGLSLAGLFCLDLADRFA